MNRKLIIVICLLAAASTGYAERLKFSELGENEVIMVDFFSTGCFHRVSRQYLVRGGVKKIFTVTDQKTEWRNGVNYVTGKALLGDMELGADDLAGLDVLVTFYRTNIKGSCTTSDTIQMDYFRNGKLIGRDNYQDNTCVTLVRDVDGDADFFKGMISAKMLRSIVSFDELDQRVRDMKTANHAAEFKRNAN